MVVTTDAVVEGVHFLPGTDPELVARKLLRVNLSDLAAKAAEPFGYWLTVAWPGNWDEPARAAFARGLDVDGAEFGIRLLGGDTVSTPGPMTASVTAMGHAPDGKAVRRSGARAGDVLMVSGAIGDGWLGLQAARGELELPPERLAALADRYVLPQPRLDLRSLLATHATAALDISDGLIADLAHLARASDVGLELDLERLPVSPAAEVWLAGRPDPAEALVELASGGDDYELAFTVASEALPHLPAARASSEPSLTIVGRVTAGKEVQVWCQGEVIRPARLGWRHG